MYTTLNSINLKADSAVFVDCFVLQFIYVNLSLNFFMSKIYLIKNYVDSA